MVKPAVFHSSIQVCNAPSLPKSRVIVHTGNIMIAIVPPSAGPSHCRYGPTKRPKPSESSFKLFAPRAIQLIGAQVLVRCKRRSCTKRKPCPECALSDHLRVDVMAKVPTGALVISSYTVNYTDGHGGCDDNRKSRVTRTLRSTGAQARAYDQTLKASRLGVLRFRDGSW